MLLSLSAFLLLILFIICIAIFYWYGSMPRRLPKGPNGLPFLGAVIDKKNPHLHLTEMAKEYGPMFSFYRFGELVVVLNSYELVRDLIVKQGDKFSNRTQTDLTIKEMGGNYGLITSNGYLWKEQRRFALSTLRDFGLGKPILEGSIVEEAEMLVSAISQELKAPFDVQSLLNKATSNVISRLTYGKRFDYSDEHIFYILDTWNRRMKRVNPITPLGITLSMVPFIPGLKKNIELMMEENETTRSFSRQMIQEHKEMFNPMDEPTDYVFAYMNRQHKENGNPNTTFTDFQLVVACNQIFAAGTETTATTLRWALLYCAIHQDVQEKVFIEIKDNIGLYLMPKLHDRIKMPYTEAVILETQRFSTLVPLASKQASEDVYVNGYRIPALATVIVNHWAIHKDSNNFHDPHEFIPERFIDENGKVKKDDRLMPFGSGKRVCLGESLAKMELTLFFVSLIQRFKFEIPEEDPTPSLEGITGITVQPVPFRLKITSRLDN